MEALSLSSLRNAVFQIKVIQIFKENEGKKKPLMCLFMKQTQEFHSFALTCVIICLLCAVFQYACEVTKINRLYFTCK